MAGSEGSGNIYVVKAKRQIGKSILAIVELIVFAFSTAKRKTTNVVLEPTLNQSRRVFKQIVDLFEGTGLITQRNESLLTLRFLNGSEILFKSAEQEEALRGFTVNGLLVIDEGAYITDDVYEIVFPTVDANKAPILIISTPLFQDGYFYNLFIKGLSEDGRKNGIFSFDWNNYDTSVYLTPAKLELYRQTLSPVKFKCDYLGEFLTDGSLVFGDVRKRITESFLDPVAGGIDWAAGGGNDDTVVTLMDEQLQATEILELNNMSPTEQIERIGLFVESHPTVRKLHVELNSIGEVYFDLLKQRLPKMDIVGFNTSNESKRRIIEQLIKAFDDGTIGIPDNPKLIRELQRLERQKLKTGYTYNAVSGSHDDYVISLALVYDILQDANKAKYVISFRSKPKVRHIPRLAHD